MKLAAISLAAAVAFAGAPALAQEKQRSGGSGELHGIMMSSAKTSQGMKMSGDVDRDFLTMMRHHHQSGIRMAEVEVRQGKDEQARELARKIIDGQKKEIAEIDALLKKQKP